jgi:hypothetical protein
MLLRSGLLCLVVIKKLWEAERKIAVEIKSFLNTSVITDFHAALGQFLNYRLALQMTESERILYLEMGIPKEDIILGLHPSYKRPYTGYGESQTVRYGANSFNPLILTIYTE